MDKQQEIRKDIQRTRKRMGSTIETIEERLSGPSLARKAIGYGSDKTASIDLQSAARTVTEGLRANPVATALIGAGVALAAVPAEKKKQHVALVGEKAHTLFNGDAMEKRTQWNSVNSQSNNNSNGDSNDSFSEKVMGSTESAKEMYRDYRDQGVEAVHRAHSQSPLLVAGGCFLLGAIAGYLIPNSKKEHALLGSHADSLMKESREAAARLTKKAEEKANEQLKASRKMNDVSDSSTGNTPRHEVSTPDKVSNL